MQLDARDQRILDELQVDARLTMVELGRRVHLSHPAVTERVRRLEDCGVICGYRAHLDAKQLGFGVRAWVRVGRADWDCMAALIASTPEVIDAFNVTGDDSWVMLIVARGVEHLDDLLARFSELGETATSVVLRALRERGPLPVATLGPSATEELSPRPTGFRSPDRR
ncbi:MAG: Lrp/AsnC family transcriptional regulator [Hyphomonadaceae bacterium]